MADIVFHVDDALIDGLVEQFDPDNRPELRTFASTMTADEWALVRAWTCRQIRGVVIAYVCARPYLDRLRSGREVSDTSVRGSLSQTSGDLSVGGDEEERVTEILRRSEQRPEYLEILFGITAEMERRLIGDFQPGTTAAASTS